MKLFSAFTDSTYGYWRGALTLLLGLAIVIWPGTAVNIIITVIGSFLIAMGVFSLIVAYKASKQGQDVSMAIVNGVINICFGLVLIIFTGFFVGIIMFIFGALLLILGVSQLISLIQLHKITPVPWFMYITPSLIIASGILIFFNPFRTLEAIFIFFGIMLIIYSLSEIISTAQFRKR